MRSITIVRPFRCIKKNGKYYDRVKSAEHLKAYLDIKWEPGVFAFDRFDEFGEIEKINVFSFDKFVSMITNYNAVKEACELIRKTENKDERNFYKSTRLPSIFWGQFLLQKIKTEKGVESYQFVDDGLLCHSGIICIDVDNIDSSIMKSIATRIDADTHTLMRFLSPSGNGYKILMRCDDDICGGLHNEFYAAAITYWKAVLPMCNIDSSCKNPSRRCYMSHDPMPYVNKNCEIWNRREEVAGSFDSNNIIRTIEDDKIADIFSICVFRVKNGWRTILVDNVRKQVQKDSMKIEWKTGQKHNFMTALSGMCAGIGMTYNQFEIVAKNYLIDEHAIHTAQAMFKNKNK